MTVSDCIEATAEAFGVLAPEIRGRCCVREIAYARFAAMTLAREGGHSYPAIARAFGGRDHSGVMHAVKRASELSTGSEAFAAALGAARTLAEAKAQERAARIAKLREGIAQAAVSKCGEAPAQATPPQEIEALEWALREAKAGRLRIMVICGMEAEA